ncbi:MAG: hypothetical protein M9961_10850 [Ilumatobacteraceae bacterium]|nr:hypothetical protein [Ilumatobacteraceae bacterium]
MTRELAASKGYRATPTWGRPIASYMGADARESLLFSVDGGHNALDDTSAEYGLSSLARQCLRSHRPSRGHGRRLLRHHSYKRSGPAIMAGRLGIWAWTPDQHVPRAG